MNFPTDIFSIILNERTNIMTIDKNKKTYNSVVTHFKLYSNKIHEYINEFEFDTPNEFSVGHFHSHMVFCENELDKPSHIWNHNEW